MLCAQPKKQRWDGSGRISCQVDPWGAGIHPGQQFFIFASLTLESNLFLDADMLENIGPMGIKLHPFPQNGTRAGLDVWTPDLMSADNLIRRFSQKLPGVSAQRRGESLRPGGRRNRCFVFFSSWNNKAKN